MSHLPDSHPVTDRCVRRLLVVDDEPTLRLGFAYALTNHRTMVDTAGTGRQALEKIAKHRFDIIVLDLRMPDIDGFGVIERLRDEGSDLPVVLCTAALTPIAAIRAIEYHVVDFLLKPVRPVDLRNIIQFVLEPAADSYATAMSAARLGDFDLAIKHLAGSDPTDTSVKAWLNLLEIMQGTDPDKLETANRALNLDGLSRLAFRSP